MDKGWSYSFAVAEVKLCWLASHVMLHGNAFGIPFHITPPALRGRAWQGG
jgi:hypothetical protein